jgi:hypothetical protein
VGGREVARKWCVQTPAAAIRLQIFMCHISVSDIARRELPDSSPKRTISTIVVGGYMAAPTPALVDAAAAHHPGNVVSPRISSCGVVIAGQVRPRTLARSDVDEQRSI